ncbi:hypothetical protein IF2G_06156 [Cordyceps javanica]|nr:hypothetical protein IF2G_06156 [Cordyceps javanica]
MQSCQCGLNHTYAWHDVATAIATVYRFDKVTQLFAKVTPVVGHSCATFESLCRFLLRAGCDSYSDAMSRQKHVHVPHTPTISKEGAGVGV